MVGGVDDAAALTQCYPGLECGEENWEISQAAAELVRPVLQVSGIWI